MNIRTISFFYVCAAAAICALPLPAMDWPTTDARIKSNFGWNDRGRPILGTVFEGAGGVLAAEEGELIFYRSAGNTAGRLPSPLGTWCAIDHRDGLISMYSRLDAQTTSPPVNIERGLAIAASGISGWAERSGFYFVLYDRRERRWVNPSMIISPFPDTRPPQITAVELHNSQGVPVSVAGLRSLAQGRYTIFVTAVDTMQSPQDQPLAPHRIICSINGTQVGSLNFETLCARGGQLMVNRDGLIPAGKIFALFPAFETGEALLSRGQANLEVIVQDIAGNSRSTLLRMLVE